MAKKRKTRLEQTWEAILLALTLGGLIYILLIPLTLMYIKGYKAGVNDVKVKYYEDRLSN